MPNPRPSFTTDPPRTVVVIPTYNEAGNITTVLNRVRAAALDVDILVVDDNSPDGTAALVMIHLGFSLDDLRRHERQGRVYLLSRTTKDGLGAAYRAGFNWALAHGYDAVVQMDADLSHPAERIPALLQALDSADVAVGSRYVPGGRVINWSPSRRLISRAGNIYVGLVLGLPVHDTTAGFKAFRRTALELIGAVESASNGYCFQVENTWRAVRLGLQVTEIPITFTDRTVGTSKMSGSIVAEALTRVLAWRWNELRARAGRGAPKDHNTENWTSVMRWHEPIRRLRTREVLTFLAVGGTGYVVDVAAFNVLRSMHSFATMDASVARTLAVALAMCVTYIGNRSLTWRHGTSGDRRREVGLFVLFNVIGFGFSIVTLVVSHDVLGLTSRLADNISANVVGLALGTVFRYLTYKRFVFAIPLADSPSNTSPTATVSAHWVHTARQTRADLPAREVPVA